MAKIDENNKLFKIKKKEKIMKEYFSNIMREKVIQDQEAQRLPLKMNPKRPTPSTSYLKWLNLKTNRES